jgi:hypothetical protein
MHVGLSCLCRAVQSPREMRIECVSISDKSSSLPGSVAAPGRERRDGSPPRLIWEGPFFTPGSLACVNRHLCGELLTHVGRGLELIPTERDAFEPSTDTEQALRTPYRVGLDAVSAHGWSRLTSACICATIAVCAGRHRVSRALLRRCGASARRRPGPRSARVRSGPCCRRRTTRMRSANCG